MLVDLQRVASHRFWGVVEALTSCFVLLALAVAMFDVKRLSF
jgi:hypothetical protein